MTVSLPAHRQPSRPAGHGRSEAQNQGSGGQRLAGLPTPPPLQLVPQPEGLLQIHTAPFRGSMAAVFSQALRTAGLGSRVLVSQFLRGGVEQGVAGSLRLCGRLQWLRPATPLCIEEPLDQATDPQSASAALEAVLDSERSDAPHSLESLIHIQIDR
jgi:cob(I)alamin adenosyltransferase